MIGILTVASKVASSESTSPDLSPPHQLPPRAAQPLESGLAFATSFMSPNDPRGTSPLQVVGPWCGAEPPGLPPAHQGSGYSAQSNGSSGVGPASLPCSQLKPLRLLGAHLVVGGGPGCGLQTGTPRLRLCSALNCAAFGSLALVFTTKAGIST